MFFLKDIKNRFECVEKYRKEINKDLFQYDNSHYEELAHKLLNNEISLSELKNYNITLEELITRTGYMELCKFAKNNISICNQQN